MDIESHGSGKLVTIPRKKEHFWGDAMEGQRFFRLGHEMKMMKMMKMDQIALLSSIFHQVGRHLFTGYFSVHSHNGAIKPRKCRRLGM